MKITNIPNYCIEANRSAKSVEKQEQSTNDYYTQFSSATSNAIKNNAISSINFKGKNDEIQDIITKLKNEYGIEATFTNLYTAQTLLECVEDFVKLNNKDIFQGLKIDTFAENKNYMWSTSANYDNKKFTLRLNNFKSEQEVKELAKSEYDKCLIPANDEKYYFYEGLAGFLNFNYNVSAYFNNLNSKTNQFSDAILKCARKISNGATISFERFNDAYIASRMCGVEIPISAKKFFLERCGSDVNLPPTKIIKSQFSEKSNFTSVEEATEHLKQYGIDAEFVNLLGANLMVSAIEDFIQINNNPEMFKGLKIRVNKSDNNTYGSVRTSYDYDNHKINYSVLELNSAYDWNRHKKRTWDSYNSGHYASADEKYSMYHELAHWLHFHDSPENYSRTSDKFKYGEVHVNDYGKRVFGKVSGYAQKSSLEFIAEYIAARMCGHKFPESVNKEYHCQTNLSLTFPEKSQFY